MSAFAKLFNVSQKYLTYQAACELCQNTTHKMNMEKKHYLKSNSSFYILNYNNY